MKELMVIGRSCFVGLPQEKLTAVPAKVDTGADRSSIWASNIFIDEKNLLHFTLFEPGAEWYTGYEHAVKDYRATRIRSSNGQDEIRYRVVLPIVIAGRKVRATFTLADRSKNIYPILVGRSLLYKKFLVDVAQDDTQAAMSERLHRRTKPLTLDEEMKQDPKAFYEKYHGIKN